MALAFPALLIKEEQQWIERIKANEDKIVLLKCGTKFSTDEFAKKQDGNPREPWIISQMIYVKRKPKK